MNSDVRRGTLAVGVAYVLWGAFPLYFRLLKAVGAVEVLAHRVVWSAVLCLVLVSLLRAWRPVVAVLAAPRLVGTLALAAVLLAVNWGVYVWSVSAGHVVDASLGYFINPLVTILLGVVVLRERLTRVQWVATGVATAAVIVLTVDAGRLPWIALTLAASFGLYGFFKKQVGADVDALSGMSVETFVLALPALGYLAWVHGHGEGAFGHLSVLVTVLLSLTGFITVGPLLLYAAAARRIPLSTIGLLQYITPVLQFALGVLIFHEPMPAARLAGFALVWIALIALAVDGVRRARRPAEVPLIDPALVDPLLEELTASTAPIDPSGPIDPGGPTDLIDPADPEDQAARSTTA